MLLTLRRLAFKSSNIKVPIVDVKPFLTDAPSSKADCKVVTQALHKYGCLVIKDPRVNQKDNSDFIDLMERYFLKRGQDFYKGIPVKEVYPQYDFQVGATPEFTQICRDHKEILQSYKPQHKAITPSPPIHDAKWRYFWNIQTGQNKTSLYANPNPQDFPEFTAVMDKWGRHMIEGCYVVAQMAAIGMGLQRETFSKMLDGGQHKLAPTGSDLVKFKPGTIFAGHHYDFNFLTIHGKSRYPGLFAWLRTGQKFTVQVPEGHLLLQAGKQFEWLTGGYINCGFHQVIYTEKVEEGKNQAIKQNRIPWRISSTLFSHLNLDIKMKPLGKFATPQSNAKYPQILVSEHTLQQLDAINLKGS